MRAFVILVTLLQVAVSPISAPGVGASPVQAVAKAAVGAAVSTVPGREVRYGLPVGGVIIDPYRPPSHPYGPGNRGVDLRTTPGSAVGAPADGEVVFAGQVGGDRFVVILHADGVRTTLGYLATIVVGSGQRVHAGQWVGTATSSVHFGARIGQAYIDPLSLLATGLPKVWLVPARR